MAAARAGGGELVGAEAALGADDDEQRRRRGERDVRHARAAAVLGEQDARRGGQREHGAEVDGAAIAGAVERPLCLAAPSAIWRQRACRSRDGRASVCALMKGWMRATPSSVAFSITQSKRSALSAATASVELQRRLAVALRQRLGDAHDGTLARQRLEPRRRSCGRRRRTARRRSPTPSRRTRACLASSASQRHAPRPARRRGR